ncbi:MAG TPA: type II toxin-antitoxin system RelE/ParE family toxin [Candidatus Binatia bacterium]|nr:type II toxin-antitoxin system RelE/ParE family toxin [Candidatus Binatia bacterium]
MATPNARLHPNAIAEARAAYRWYSERNPSAAIAFMTELDHAIDEIEKSPERWPVHLHGTRKFLLRRFPYGVIYRITERDLQVIAVAHGRRRPGYWRTRRL